MKKRLISLLLTLVMVVSLCPAFAATASADATVTTVTLNSGDTVLSLCQKIGVDYYAHKNLIMSLNGFTSEAQFSKMAVGSQVVLPVSNAAAAGLSGSGVGTTTAATATATTGGTGFVAGTTTSIPTGDYVSYYLVAYTIQPGETIAGIYNNWGLSYKTYSNQILKLNNISNYNSIPAGKTLLLPTTNPAVSGSSYTTVMAHVMRSGDSAYNIICSDYGLNYNAVQTQVQALNNRENLANFMVGEVLYIPVSGLVSSSTTVTPGTGSISSSATINGSAAYNLVSQTPTNGTFSLLVDGVAASTAFAGKTVSILATPNTGYAVSAISVTKVGDPNTSVTVSGNAFVMPSYSVSVSVSFTQAIVSDINFDKTSNGAVIALVNNASVSSATAGNLVTLKTLPASGFMLDTIRVTYNDYRDTLAVEDGKFTMPAFPVTVTATFKEDPNYDPNAGHAIYVYADNCEVVSKIGETKVSSAKAGDRVTLEVTPNENYTIQDLSIYYDNFNKTLDIEKNAFTMPDSPVTIVANVKPTADAAFNITKVHNSDGDIYVIKDEQEVSSAKVGEKVYVFAYSTKSFFNYIPTVFKTGDTNTTVPVAEDGSFVMPDYPVTVSVKFYLYRNVYLDASNGVDGFFNVTSAANGLAVSKCAPGVELKVTVWGYNQNTHVPSDVIVTYEDGSVHTFNGSTFIMPDCDIKVRVNFNPAQLLVAHSVTTPAKVGNSYSVLGKVLTDSSDYYELIPAGEHNTIVITPYTGFGHQVDVIRYTYTPYGQTTPETKQVNINPITGKYQFEMPKLAEKTYLELFVQFKETPTYDINFEYNADNSDHHMGTVTALTSLGVVTSSVGGNKINLKFQNNEGFNIDYANITVNTDAGPVELNRNDYSFFMPEAPVTVYVPFKSDNHTVKLALAATPAGDVQPKGVINAVVDGVKYTDDMLTAERKLPVNVKEGSTVTIINESREGFILDPNTPILVTRVSTGVPIEVRMESSDRFTFKMPDDDVVVVAQYIDDMYNIIATESEHGTYYVPAQAAYNETEGVKVIPGDVEPGYELSQILVSYTDHLGKIHSREPITNGTSFIPAGGGIPLTAVTFEVIFAPVLNPLTINYIFDQTPNSSSNYFVDLIVNGEVVKGIERTSMNSNVLNVDVKEGRGIPTGSSVIISRQEHNSDKNFEITNIWITVDGRAISPEYSNGQCFFKMPYVESGLASKMVVNIQYSKATADSFNLSSYPAEGVIGSASVEFTVFTVDDSGSVSTVVSTVAKPKQKIVAKLTPDDASYVVKEAYLCYMDSDNVGHRDPVTVELDKNTGIGYITIANDEITSLPVSKTVYIEYVTEKRAYKVSCVGDPAGGDYQYFVDGKDVTVTDSANKPVALVKWGDVVTIVPSKTGYAATSIEAKTASGDIIPTNAGFMFEMPKEDVTVTVKYEPAAYKLNLAYEGEGEGTAVVSDGVVQYSDGSAIPFGKKLTITAIPNSDTDSKCTKITVNGSGSNLAKNADGSYSTEYTSGAADVNVTVTFAKNTYVLEHGAAIDSTGSDYTLIIDGKEYVPDDSVSITVGKSVSVIPGKGFALENAFVVYEDRNGDPVEFDLNSFIADADGNAAFYLTELPAVDSKVQLGITLASLPKTYSLKDESSSAAKEQAYISFTSGVDSEGNAPGNAKVTGTVAVNYRYRLVDHLILKYASKSDTVPLTLSHIANEGLLAVYTFEFYMPNADVSYSYSASEAKATWVAGEHASINPFGQVNPANYESEGFSVSAVYGVYHDPAYTDVRYIEAEYNTGFGGGYYTFGTKLNGVIPLHNASATESATEEDLNPVYIHVEYTAN